MLPCRYRTLPVCGYAGSILHTEPEYLLTTRFREWTCARWMSRAARWEVPFAILATAENLLRHGQFLTDFTLHGSHARLLIGSGRGFDSSSRPPKQVRLRLYQEYIDLMFLVIHFRKCKYMLCCVTTE
jgi:hypothetical protein